jgi:hypothetical protein
LRHFAFVDIRLRVAIYVFVPQQSAASALLGFQRWLGSFELGYEQSGV